MGFASVMGSVPLPHLGRVPLLSDSGKNDIAVVKGSDYLKNTMEAVKLLGGIKKFVPKKSKVALLPNSQHKNIGTYTKPDIVRAVVKLCKQAGAKEIICLSWLPKKLWDETGITPVLEEEGANLRIVDMKDESLYKKVSIPKGKVLQEARIISALYENDVFITMPIAKDHAGNRFTGTLKNMMGLNLQALNMFFHTGKFKKPDNITHLDQCIADLNTVLKPTLCIVDATEFIITHGPFGPGKVIKPQKVVAGIDRVAVDAFCSTLWGLKPEEIIMIRQAYEHGLGEIDLKKMRILEIEI